MEHKIVIAENDESVRRMIARVLEIAGYNTIPTASWREARVKCTAIQPALLLLNLEMLPGVHWNPISQLRQDFEIPVIGFTAWPNQYEEATRLGIDCVMEKPLDLGLLLRTIDKLLSKTHAVSA